MKRLLIAAAVLSLAGSSVAWAQANPPSPSNSDQSSTMPPSAMGPTPSTVSPPATDNTSMSTSASTGSMQSGATSNGAMAMNTGSMVGDQTSANPAPTSYPRCTHKGQDRCRTKGG